MYYETHPKKLVTNEENDGPGKVEGDLDEEDNPRKGLPEWVR